MKIMKSQYWFIVAILSVLLPACSLHKDFEIGREATQQKDWDKAVAYFLKAVNEHPKNLEYRIALNNALFSASNLHLQRGKGLVNGGRLKQALIEFEKALEFNPENNAARKYKHSILKQLKALDQRQKIKTGIQETKERAAQNPLQTPEIQFKKKPYTLKFSRTGLKQVFKALQKSSGVHFIFAPSFKSKKVALHLQDVGFMEALKVIMLESHMFYKVIDNRTIMIIPDTPSMRKEYEELVMKTLFLSSSNAEDVQKLIKPLTTIKTIVFDKELNAITLKGRPEQVKLAEHIVRLHDKPKGELFVDIEIIEVNRARIKEYGIELSQYQINETYAPEGSLESASTIKANLIGHTDASDYLLSLPTIHYKMLKTDRHSRIKARPQLRVLDRQKVEVMLGDKVPIPMTNFVPYNTAGPAQQPITSYQMQEVGIKIEVTPHIHHDGLITLQMTFELTFITNPGTDRLPPTLGNRTVKTHIKLKDSETSILAGLLRDTERKSLRGFPFLSRVPILKEIFSGNKNEVEQTDIILTLTPRIIRFPDIREGDLAAVWAGTFSRPGLKAPPQSLQLTEDPQENVAASHKTSRPNHPGQSIKPAPVQPVQSDTSIGIHLQEKSANTYSVIMTPGKNGGSVEIRAVTLEMAFTPGNVEIQNIRKGSIVQQTQPGTGAKIKSHLLKHIDNPIGIFKCTLSLDQPLTLSGAGEIAIIEIKTTGTGNPTFRPVNSRVLDQQMKIIPSRLRAGEQSKKQNEKNELN
jgi:general secretion pathway protein D